MLRPTTPRDRLGAPTLDRPLTINLAYGEAPTSPVQISLATSAPAISTTPASAGQAGRRGGRLGDIDAVNLLACMDYELDAAAGLPRQVPRRHRGR
jgi:hypothetical protein